MERPLWRTKREWKSEWSKFLVDAGNKQHWDPHVCRELKPTMRTRWKKKATLSNFIQLWNLHFPSKTEEPTPVITQQCTVLFTQRLSFALIAPVFSHHQHVDQQIATLMKKKKKSTIFLQCVAWWSWWWSFTIIRQLHRWYTIKLSSSHQSEQCYLPIVILVRCPLIRVQRVSTFSNQADVVLLWSP